MEADFLLKSDIKKPFSALSTLVRVQFLRLPGRVKRFAVPKGLPGAARPGLVGSGAVSKQGNGRTNVLVCQGANQTSEVLKTSEVLDQAQAIPVASPAQAAGCGGWVI